MILETVRTGGCMSYLVGCERRRAAIVIDPERSQVDHYLALAAKHALAIARVLDTHTHADHFSGARALARRVDAPVFMHRASPSPFVDTHLDDGETVIVGELRLRVIHTPGHTRDSISLVVDDPGGGGALFTGDTLLVGSCGRTDLPTGDPSALYDSLFERLVPLDDALVVYPAHDYKHTSPSTLGAEKRANPRLAARTRADFVATMQQLDLALPRHLTEALRTNSTGGKTVAELLEEAAREISFMSLDELARRVVRGDGLVVLDVRERDAFAAGHVPGARHIPRGQLELRINDELADPSARIVLYCELGKISTLATAQLKQMGYLRAVALDGGMRAWREAGHPVEGGSLRDVDE